MSPYSLTQAVLYIMSRAGGNSPGKYNIFKKNRYAVKFMEKWRILAIRFYDNKILEISGIVCYISGGLQLAVQRKGIRYAY
jgi:hypothetical protein